MTHKLTPLIGAIAAVAIFATPALTLADNAPQTYVTSLTESGISASPVPYRGTLELTISSDGVVSGWYRPDYNGSFIPVTGGERSGKLWLNIGESGQLQLTADVQKDGSLIGSAVDDGMSVRAGAPTFYDFSASLKTV